MSPLPTGTVESPASGESHIEDLLGLGLPDNTSGSAAEDTSVAGTDTDVLDDQQVDTQDDGTDGSELETGADDAQDQGDETQGDETGEEDFDATSLEPDFAESAYQRAASHWEKRGKKFDLQDSGDRAVLKDWMERGQKIAELNAKPAEQPRQDAKPAEAEKPPEPVKTPQEMMALRLSGAKEYAKSILNPEVAMQFSQQFVDAMWPGKNVKMSQEQANAMTEAFSMFGSLLIADAFQNTIPAIMGQVPKEVSKAFPMFDRVISMAERESVVEELVNARDDKGSARYPGMEKLIDNGTIKRIMNGPDLKDAVFTKDPHQNMIRRAQVAYQMARGQNLNPQVVAKAVQRGREQANARARSVAAGRTPPGSSGRGFTNNSQKTLKQQLLEPNKGGFHALLHAED